MRPFSAGGGHIMSPLPLHGVASDVRGFNFDQPWQVIRVRSADGVPSHDLAAELADIYPGIERQLVDLFTRLDANDREVNYVNTRLPTNTERLRLAELVTRGLPGLVKNGIQIERMAELLALPAFAYSALHPLAWPR
jgi:hypothetical protein